MLFFVLSVLMNSKEIMSMTIDGMQNSKLSDKQFHDVTRKRCSLKVKL